MHWRSLPSQPGDAGNSWEVLGGVRRFSGTDGYPGVFGKECSWEQHLCLSMGGAVREASRRKKGGGLVLEKTLIWAECADYVVITFALLGRTPRKKILNNECNLAS